MPWQVLFADPFVLEFSALPIAAQDALLARALLLQRQGPHLSRPHADTLKGSRYANMKELRFQAAGGVWRVAYAFDPLRRAILLVAGDKAGVGQDRFYQSLLERADDRFHRHLISLTDDPHGKIP
jgi:hypothetical protein